MKLCLVVLAFVPAMIACASCRETPITPPNPDDSGAGGAPAPNPSAEPDAGPELDPCERACQRLTELGCEEAEPTEGGASCVEVCRNVEDSGAVSLDPDCVAQLAACADIDACVVVLP